MENIGMFGKVLALVVTFQFFSLIGFAQAEERVVIRERNDKTESELREDKQYCTANAKASVRDTEYKRNQNVLKGRGMEEASGSIIENQDFKGTSIKGQNNISQIEYFNHVFASCMRYKDYQVDIYKD